MRCLDGQGFNSTMVRLKAIENGAEASDEVLGFNSTMVRLKANQDREEGTIQ